MVSFTQKGDFKGITNFLKNVTDIKNSDVFNKVGREGVAALSAATPIDSGETANSWSYDVITKKGITTISFYNSNIQNGCVIALLIQYGHLSRNNTWVQGHEYINTALQPIFENAINYMQKEVKNV